MQRSFFLVSILAIVLLVPSLAVAADSCITATCHSAVLAAKRPHSPAKDGDCLSCHKQTSPQHPVQDQKNFTLTATGEKLCATCHESPGKGPVVHPPVRDGDCLDCHHPHGSDSRFLLRSSDLSVLCFNCHDKTSFSKAQKHGPAAAGECTACHDPHRSAGKKLLPAKLNDACLGCHDDIKQSLASAGYVHPPIKVSSCAACHEPHSSEYPYLARKKMPDLCYGCHKSLQGQLAKLKQLHKPLSEPRGCGSCHNPHSGASKKLLAADEQELCLSCHGDKKVTPLKNIRAELKGKKYLHGPLAQKQCTGCHDPHGSGNFRLLKGAYPTTFYAPYSLGAYDLCLRCHNKNLLSFAETTVHTKFRNGKRNLHYIHVVNDRKGRSCRVCHEPHAADGPKLTNPAGPTFGKWHIPFNLTVTETGGSCSSGCHQALSYDREKPVSYTRP